MATIVDIPKVTLHNKYNLEQLKALPTGKAMMFKLSSATKARTARGVVWNYCKRHKLNSRTHTEQNNHHYNLYVWLT